MGKYIVWEAHLEKWNKDDLPKPDATVDAKDPEDAAKQFSDRSHFSEEAAVIVRDEKTGSYYEIEMIKAWELDVYNLVTLDELCEP